MKDQLSFIGENWGNEREVDGVVASGALMVDSPASVHHKLAPLLALWPMGSSRLALS
jgi:hypothetical protein